MVLETIVEPTREAQVSGFGGGVKSVTETECLTCVFSFFSFFSGRV